MAIDRRTYSLLNQKGIEVVRAKYIKEKAVTGDTAADLKKTILFGDDKVSFGDIEEWLGKKERSNSSWIKVAGIAAIAAAVIAFLAWVFPIK
jgi:hypothetical protein